MFSAPVRSSANDIPETSEVVQAQTKIFRIWATAPTVREVTGKTKGDMNKETQPINDLISVHEQGQ